MALPQPHPIRWLRMHPAAADMILAVVLTASSLAVHLLNVDTDSDTEVRDPTWWTVPFVVASTFPIAWRRSHPVFTALFVTGAQIVTTLLSIEGTGFIGVVIALYSLGAHATGTARTRAVSVIAAAIALLFIAGLFEDELNIAEFVSSVIVLITAFVLGDNLRRRRDAATELVERAERAERERELIANQRVNAERSRIARELHDVVAHSVSVMVIQAAAARRSLTTSPDNAEQALSTIEETGRQTMSELRGILGVLRRADPEGADDAQLVPQPHLGDVVGLVAVSGDLPITLDVEGSLDDLPPGVALTGYRVVQEAMTNIRRHAGPVTAVELHIARTATTVTIRIDDDGRGAAADDTDAGYGLAGMRERVAAVGGSVEARPRPGGGWRVVAEMPVTMPSRADSEVHA